MITKIDGGLSHVSDTVFLHTEPHHDDIMLAYLAHIYHLVRDATNVHYFANLTSGFTSVSNAYMLSQVKKLEKYSGDLELRRRHAEGFFDPSDVQAPDGRRVPLPGRRRRRRPADAGTRRGVPPAPEPGRGLPDRAT